MESKIKASVTAQELRIGNRINEAIAGYIQVNASILSHIDEADNYQPIELSEQVLLKCGFEAIPNSIITRSHIIHLKRDTYLSVSNTGTPNEMAYLQCIEEDEHGKKKITDLICIHNFDYDGKLHLHTLQNICRDHGKELEFKA